MSTTCYLHPKNTANTTCEECERPICANDHRRITVNSYQGSTTVVEKKLVCPECKDTIDAKQKKTTKIGNTIAIILIVAIVGFTIAVLTNPRLLG